ncbi:hypothetical protein AABB24_038113 [Solanum stoloniferum]|uniref:Protein kinase domain-containing protein n=1 Tax=Solanum stoloniferum TaxID=62892 RepID=A0ABD2QWA3_9SOLN
MITAIIVKSQLNLSNTQMSKGNSQLKYFTLFLQIIFLQTSNARKINCPDSACGDIRNIKYPFHLNTDPKHCRFPGYELACEGNQTVIWLSSKKLHVQGIDYANWTIHLVDPTLQTQEQDDLCFFRPQLNFNQYNRIFESYTYTNGYYKTIAEPIFMFNCPFAVNDSTFVEISGCKLSRYTYLKIGEMKVSEVSDGCRAEFIGFTSWPNIKHAENNISLSDFHQAILYGFELYYGPWGFGKRISVALMIFWWSSVALPQLFVMYLGAKFVIGFPLVIAFLVYKFKRRHLSMYDTIEGFLRTQNNFMPIRYNYSNIKRMTRGFKEKLGEGGYGTVYKGKLQSGRDVAVKMLSKPKAGGQDFMNEVATIVTLTAARGTIGYVAPELISRSIGSISHKADVYSFGMLLMEMLDLKRNEVANEENSSQYFPYNIYDKFNKGKEIVVDEEANDVEKKMARKLSLVALWCIQTNPIQRPSMSKVVEMLEGEVEVLEVPPQPLQSQPIVHQIVGSSTTFSSDSIALLDNPVEVDIYAN